MRKRCGILSLALIVVLSSTASLTAEVYRWRDEKGVVHYSNKPPEESAKPADLPPITRAEMKLPEVKDISCEQHGGIDCQAGADVDGTVICYDGFRGATVPYRFACSSPKLAIADVAKREDSNIYSVYVRNSNSVLARGTVVYFVAEDGSEIKIDGPNEIEPFGMAEFTMASEDEYGLENKVLGAQQFRVDCTNCS